MCGQDGRGSPHAGRAVSQGHPVYFLAIKPQKDIHVTITMFTKGWICEDSSALGFLLPVRKRQLLFCRPGEVKCPLCWKSRLFCLNLSHVPFKRTTQQGARSSWGCCTSRVFSPQGGSPGWWDWTGAQGEGFPRVLHVGWGCGDAGHAWVTGCFRLLPVRC